MWKFLVVILVIVQNVECAKILGVFHMTARSHYILGSALTTALAEKGHDVTMISPFGEKEPPKNGSYRDIILTGLAEQHDKKIKELGVFTRRKIHPILMVAFLPKMMLEMTEQVLNHTNVQKLINSGEKFDVVIIEEFANHALKSFASHFGAHLVVLSTVGSNVWVNDLVGNPTPLSYIPDPVSGYSAEMTFCERVMNTVMYALKQVINHLYINPKHNELSKKYFSNSPDLKETMYNVSLVLLNSHPSTNQPAPYVPNMVDIGGYHVKPPKELPSDLKTLIEDDRNGIIYFSLGSNMKSSLLPPEKRQIFINAFSKLKHTVIWKWEEDVLPGKPDNVHIAKWLPQQDILAHPNVKLFITHAGLLSTIEIIYHGMPVLAIPIGGDQQLNAKQIVDKGIGLSIDFSELDEDIFLEKIEQLLNDPKYRDNAKTRSNFFHDRLVNPLETAVYWIEYVIRHGGAPHLRVAGVNLPWYQYLLLDIFAFVAAIVLFIVILMKKVAQKILKGRSTPQPKKKKVKKH